MNSLCHGLLLLYDADGFFCVSVTEVALPTSTDPLPEAEALVWSWAVTCFFLEP